MAIEVEIQDGEGNLLMRYDGPSLGLPFVKLAPSQSTCFRFILPWSDTTFNEAQIQILKDEIREVASKTDNSNRLNELTALTSFLERAVGAHFYVKFLGD